MRKLFAWLGVAMLAGVCAPGVARAADPLKPYVVLALDTSGSMDESTGSGAPSCGGTDTKHNHAHCAIQNIVNSYGDMVFALGRFRMTMSGTTNGSSFPFDCDTAQPDNCDDDDDRFELLSPLVDGANQYASRWVDFTGNMCGAPTTFPPASTDDPEIWDSIGNTPLEGTLRGARRYYQGRQALDGSQIWPSNLPGFSPINTDPLKNSFLPTGCNPDPTTCAAQNNCCAEQCRPYIVILLTDGEETCGGNPADAAASLLSTPFPINVNGTTQPGYKNYRIETKPIGFSGGQPAQTFVDQIEAIAHSGGTPDDMNPNTREGFYAGNEAELQLAITEILSDAIKTETCNNLDDDCDVLVDEDFPDKGGACNNGRVGRCRVNGANACRTDGTGVSCGAGVQACVGLSANAACTVDNASNVPVAGTCQSNGNALACVPTIGTEGPTNCGIDDDCDGLIDEGVASCNCVVTGETCDGTDEDCDGTIDEGLTRPCGTGVCQGTETCVIGGTGTWGTCTADTPDTETCNGLDDDCDGNADGFNEACSNLSGGFPALDPRNNPGGDRTPDSGCELLGAQCICHPGTRTCPLNGSGTFSACVGEVTPQLEICNNLDDDCDGLVDEAPPVTCTTDTDCANTPLTPSCDNPTNMPNLGTCVPADCSTNCGVGQLICSGGQQTCNAVQAPNDDTCDGNDDDCDNVIDEDWVCDDPDGADNMAGTADDCPCVEAGTCNGEQKCANGAIVCDGDPVAQESCNCLDDNCNGEIDEGTLCGAGAECVACQCAFQCSPGEFPCPAGKKCEMTAQGNFCVADPCFGVTCPDDTSGNKQVCQGVDNAPVCVSACDPSVITCNAPLICFGPTGECKPNDCTTFPDMCQANENCVAGTCVSNPCQGVSCPTGEYCVGGTCFGSCAEVDCPDGERCRMGACVADPCGAPCPTGEVCHDETGECVRNPCEFVTCPQGQYCNPNNGGMCEDDPCLGTSCPNAGEVCLGGTCYDPASFLPDAGVETHVTTGGGGGCSTGGAGTGGTFALTLALGAMLLRRRREGGAS